ncbi:FAD-dependent oxidoreductase, partial [Bacillus cereus]|uniref:FAD-dependent oxidoreductase n=1 Tax=Bacillus cereus TaxID=1396 RepID=UPI0018F6FB13
IEPHVKGLGAIRVPSSGIADYRGVSYAFARLIQESGGEIHLGTGAERITEKKDAVTIETNKGTFKTKFLINCAGLH